MSLPIIALIMQTFTALDTQAINTIRCLCADIIQKPKSVCLSHFSPTSSFSLATVSRLAIQGHPGGPLGMAPMAHTLFSRILRFDPTDPLWIDRDRFVLSNGHASSLLYTMLHLCGYDVRQEELQTFRMKGSRLAGHPEAAHVPGVEITTGPLGNGFFVLRTLLFYFMPFFSFTVQEFLLLSVLPLLRSILARCTTDLTFPCLAVELSSSVVMVAWKKELLLKPVPWLEH
jgi:hypothetical protein